MATDAHYTTIATTSSSFRPLSLLYPRSTEEYSRHAISRRYTQMWREVEDLIHTDQTTGEGAWSHSHEQAVVGATFLC